MKFLLILTLCVFSYLPQPQPLLAAVGDVNYISDVLIVPLRSGASPGHRVIHRGLSSGTRLTILAVDEEAGFSQVRTEGGTEGWLRTQYLVPEPIARTKLASAEKRLQQLKDKVEKERQARSTIESAHKESEESNRSLNTRAESLAKELEELKRISSDAINKHARIVELTEQNDKLVKEVGNLSTTVRQLEDNVQREWLIVGGALVLIGLVLGIMLKSRPQKSSYSRYS